MTVQGDVNLTELDNRVANCNLDQTVYSPCDARNVTLKRHEQAIGIKLFV